MRVNESYCSFVAAFGNLNTFTADIIRTLLLHLDVVHADVTHKLCCDDENKEMCHFNSITIIFQKMNQTDSPPSSPMTSIQL